MFLVGLIPMVFYLQNKMYIVHIYYQVMTINRYINERNGKFKPKSGHEPGTPLASPRGAVSCSLRAHRSRGVHQINTPMSIASCAVNLAQACARQVALHEPRVDHTARAPPAWHAHVTVPHRRTLWAVCCARSACGTATVHTIIQYGD